ncbi:MAG: LPS assembly lipoprotein LptE [Gemmatimonadales bacterium]
MPLLRSILRSGVRRRRWLPAMLPLLLLASCVTHYGFAGGGLPAHIHTLAILPFDNETPSPDLQRELFDAMRKDLRSRLGVRDAAEDKADALVRGVIRTYDVDVPVGVNANDTQAVTSRRRLQLTVDVQIVDQTTGKTIFERKGLRAEGEYAERDEAGGRRDAIKRIVNDLIEGAQSQW